MLDPASRSSGDQLPADYESEVVGSVSEVHEALRSAVPDIGLGDLSTGNVLRTADTTGWHAFQAYRDQVMSAVQQEPSGE